MPETTVPVSLRDAFLEDPFFRTGWDEMNSECREMRSFAEGNNTLATMDRSWPLLPKQWMLPQLFQDFHLPEMKDSLMLGLQEENDKMEVTLDTSGYKPDELNSDTKLSYEMFEADDTLIQVPQDQFLVPKSGMVNESNSWGVQLKGITKTYNRNYKKGIVDQHKKIAPIRI